MPNMGGPSQVKRSLLGTVVNNKLLYAAPVWAERGTKIDKKINAMRRPQRTVAIRTIRAFRTTSVDASLVLANMLPANLLAMERTRIRNRSEKLGSMANIRKEEGHIGWRVAEVVGPLR